MTRKTIFQEIDELPTLPATTISSLEKAVNADKSKIYNFLLKRFSKSVKNKNSMVVLFKLANSEDIVAVSREDYFDFVNKLIEHFIKVEEYEKVIKCKTLLSKYCSR